MKRFTLSEENLIRTSRRRGAIIGSVTFLLLALALWQNDDVTVLNFSLISVVSYWLYTGKFGNASSVKYPWVFKRSEEANWEIITLPSAVAFQNRGAVSRIEGKDITAITARYRSNQLKWLDIYYGPQRTRIQYYKDLEEIYRHVRKIAASAELHEQRR
ncbi:hypothetical protein BGP77_00305 [Saccharospirillum sp. MSK14-1]|uniref:hypothetical protein n=1 Tax=Saccharospirillum sp. MSK14-1 TaxID=1897632 RepID=UPI000D3A2403|nr:hypothetical protein [Saccharospirillum sp. MSK14-1]PTY35809.1 hypothetical protein BGP77_00305 [Saccharospirillum sp. MSK14-1]